jgi:hypothetical protein
MKELLFIHLETPTNLAMPNNQDILNFRLSVSSKPVTFCNKHICWAILDVKSGGSARCTLKNQQAALWSFRGHYPRNDTEAETSLSRPRAAACLDFAFFISSIDIAFSAVKKLRCCG